MIRRALLLALLALPTCTPRAGMGPPPAYWSGADDDRDSRLLRPMPGGDRVRPGQAGGGMRDGPGELTPDPTTGEARARPLRALPRGAGRVAGQAGGRRKNRVEFNFF